MVHWGHTQFRVKSDPEFGHLSADLTKNGVRLTPALGLIPRQDDIFPGHRWLGMEFGPNAPFSGSSLTPLFLECIYMF